MMRQFLVLAIMAGLAASTGSAYGYCRATTCDPGDSSQSCERDASTDCLTTGTPLAWAGSCLTISVQSDGALSAGIDYDSATASVKRAFSAWTSVACEGGNPSISVSFSGPVSCSTSEYSGQHHNANIVMFRENDWPYEGAEDALGLTRLRFDLEDEPGALWDADIEVNAVTEPLSIGRPEANEVDLDSLLTHEAGHLLGLAHTLDVSATMAEGYQTGTTALRTPAADDIAGICAIYPPGRKTSSSSCEPRHGFSELCAHDQLPDESDSGGGDVDTTATADGCSVARAVGSRDPAGLALLVLLLALRSRTSSASRTGSKH